MCSAACRAYGGTYTPRAAARSVPLAADPCCDTSISEIGLAQCWHAPRYTFDLCCAPVETTSIGSSLNVKILASQNTVKDNSGPLEGTACNRVMTARRSSPSNSGYFIPNRTIAQQARNNLFPGIGIDFTRAEVAPGNLALDYELKFFQNANAGNADAGWQFTNIYTAAVSGASGRGKDGGEQQGGEQQGGGQQGGGGGRRRAQASGPPAGRRGGRNRSPECENMRVDPSALDACECATAFCSLLAPRCRLLAFSVSSDR